MSGRGDTRPSVYVRLIGLRSRSTRGTPPPKKASRTQSCPCSQRPRGGGVPASRRAPSSPPERRAVSHRAALRRSYLTHGGSLARRRTTPGHRKKKASEMGKQTGVASGERTQGMDGGDGPRQETEGGGLACGSRKRVRETGTRNRSRELSPRNAYRGRSREQKAAYVSRDSGGMPATSDRVRGERSGRRGAKHGEARLPVPTHQCSLLEDAPAVLRAPRPRQQGRDADPAEPWIRIQGMVYQRPRGDGGRGGHPRARITKQGREETGGGLVEPTVVGIASLVSGASKRDGQQGNEPGGHVAAAASATQPSTGGKQSTPHLAGGS